MKLLVVLVAILFYAEARPQQVEISHDRDFRFIVNGEDADVGEFPWQLSLTLSGVHFCGAALIRHDRALTAGHCTLEIGDDARDVSVIGGMHQRTSQDPSEYQTVGVDSFYRHEMFDQGDGFTPNDISILYLSGSFEFNELVYGIDLPTQEDEDFVGSDTWISGWGRIYQNQSQQLADTLQKANMDVITNEECSERMDPIEQNSVQDGMICVFNEEENGNDAPGACSGDSGGPMTSYHIGADDQPILSGLTSWGVVSLGTGCQSMYPSVYTRVSTYVDWVNTHIDAPPAV